MRFSTVIPSILLIALLAVLNVVATESQVDNNNALTSDNIEAELIYNYFENRARPEGTESTETAAANGTATNSGHGVSSTSPKATASSGHGTSAATSSSSGYSATTTSAATSTSAGTTTATTKAKAASTFANVPILQNGDLFYLGVAVTLFLWCTGKAIDVKMERQEKYAESQIHSI